MESLGILFIYILLPCFGFFFIIKGYIDYRDSKKKNGLIIGLVFILIPILHITLTTIVKNNQAKNIVGAYSIEGQKKPILELFSNKSFSLKQNPFCKYSGIGTWTIEYGDDSFNIYLEVNNDKSQNLFFKVDSKARLNGSYTSLVKMKTSN